jgi:hypothetical protein
MGRNLTTNLGSWIDRLGSNFTTNLRTWTDWFGITSPVPTTETLPIPTYRPPQESFPITDGPLFPPESYPVIDWRPPQESIPITNIPWGPLITPIPDPADMGPLILEARGPVQPLDTGTYGQLAPNSVGDDLTPDHVPSFAAIRTRAERDLDRFLTDQEWDALRRNTNTVAIDTDIHQEFSRTYGGRNNPDQILQDSRDLEGAANRDMDALRPHLLNRGYTPRQIDDAFVRLHQLNRARGLY